MGTAANGVITRIETCKSLVEIDVQASCAAFQPSVRAKLSTLLVIWGDRPVGTISL